jgi:transposase-like protein
MQARADDGGWLRTLGGPRKWRPAQGERVIAAWRASGESMNGFARRHGLKVERIRYWRERVPAGASPKALAKVESPAAFVPVVVRPLQEVRAALAMSAGGERIEIYDTARVDPRWLSQLVQGLQVEGGR